MENLYKVSEYSGRLPNPKHFPVQGGIIFAIKDRPNAFSDGFMLDLSIRERDIGMLEGRTSRMVDTIYMDNPFRDAERSKLLLSEPEFIYDIFYLAYVLFTPIGNPVIIQVKYYKYFRNKHPECSFYVKDEDYNLIAIKVDKEVVGVCMRMFCSPQELTQIKEERK